MNKKFTKKDIDSLIYEGGGDVRWDGALPGFGVRVYPSGKKAYVLSYRHNRRKRLMALGQTGKITLEFARALAFENLAKLAGKSDPLTERQRKSVERSVDSAFTEFLERHAKVKNRSWREAERIFKADILPCI